MIKNMKNTIGSGPKKRPQRRAFETRQILFSKKISRWCGVLRGLAGWCAIENPSAENFQNPGVWFARAKQAQPKVGPWATQTFRKMRSCIQKFKPPRCIGEASSNSFFKKEFA